MLELALGVMAVSVVMLILYAIAFAKMREQKTASRQVSSTDLTGTQTFHFPDGTLTITTRSNHQVFQWVAEGAPTLTTHPTQVAAQETAKGTIKTGLVIDEPWISKILAGEKSWEMRSRKTLKRERIALIRKGSGRIVGIAAITDCRGPLNDPEILATKDKHQVPLDQIGNWRYAWVLGDIQALPHPISYLHRPGAVTFVTLDSRSSSELDKALQAGA